MAAKRNHAEKVNTDEKVVGNENELNGGLVLVDQALEPLKAMLDAYEARLKPKETLEERYRAYPNPMLETKRLEILQKMIEGTQDLLEKQLNQKGSIEGHQHYMTKMGQVSRGSGDLVSKDGNITSDPQKITKRQKRISKRKQTEAKTVEAPETKPRLPKGNDTVVPNNFPEETKDTWVKSL